MSRAEKFLRVAASKNVLSQSPHRAHLIQITYILALKNIIKMIYLGIWKSMKSF